MFGWMLCLAVVAAVVAFSGPAQAHEEGAVAMCNPATFTQYGHGGYNWRWMLCNHSLHTGPPGAPGVYHTQYRNGLGTPGHTVDAMKREAAAFRAWTGRG
jgi:hypothetical protein